MAEFSQIRKVAASCSMTFLRATKRRPPTTKKKGGGIARGIKMRVGRRSCSLAITSHAASFARSRKGGGVLMVECFSISPGLSKNFRNPPSILKGNYRACTTSLNNWQTSISRSRRWKSDQQRITSWVACGSIRTRKCRACVVCLPRGNVRLGLMGRIGSAEIPFPIF